MEIYATTHEFNLHPCSKSVHAGHTLSRFVPIPLISPNWDLEDTYNQSFYSISKQQRGGHGLVLSSSRESPSRHLNRVWAHLGSPDGD